MNLQIKYVAGLFLLLPVLPFLLLQGLMVRRKVPKLPEAGINRNGNIQGRASKLRLLLMGESTIAGVGIRNHREGISGELAYQLHKMTRRPVSWHTLARSGYTSKDVRELLAPQITTEPMDCIVIGLGGNDTFRLNSPRQWRKDMEALICRIRDRQPTCPIVIAQLPPVGDFPALPNPLRWFLNRHTGLLRNAIRHLPDRFSNVHYMKQPIRLERWEQRLPEGVTVPDLFSDGIHPSALTYQIWAREIADFIEVQGLFEAT